MILRPCDQRDTEANKKYKQGDPEPEDNLAGRYLSTAAIISKGRELTLVSGAGSAKIPPAWNLIALMAFCSMCCFASSISFFFSSNTT